MKMIRDVGFSNTLPEDFIHSPAEAHPRIDRIPERKRPEN
jgi:hypothetical protein